MCCINYKSPGEVCCYGNYNVLDHGNTKQSENQAKPRLFLSLSFTS